MSFSRRYSRVAALATVSAFVLMGAAVVIAAPTPVVLQEGGFSPEDLRWDRDETGAVLPVLRGTSARLLETGDPDLPAHDLVFLVGLDQGVARLEVEAIATRVVTLTDELSLAAPLKSDTGETVAQDLLARFFHIDPAVAASAYLIHFVLIMIVPALVGGLWLGDLPAAPGRDEAGPR